MDIGARRASARKFIGRLPGQTGPLVKGEQASRNIVGELRDHEPVEKAGDNARLGRHQNEQDVLHHGAAP